MATLDYYLQQFFPTSKISHLIYLSPLAMTWVITFQKSSEADFFKVHRCGAAFGTGRVQHEKAIAESEGMYLSSGLVIRFLKWTEGERVRHC